MDHLVLPLDPAHVRVLGDLIHDVAAAVGLPSPHDAPNLHLTLIAYEGANRASVLTAVATVAASTAPFTVHAHSYGFFTGPEPTDISLHVPVVRSRQLDTLHGRLCAALSAAGARLAGWSVPDRWSPHITLLDRELDPARLGAAVAWLARRRHPSWEISVDRVALTGGWPQRHGPYEVLSLAAGEGPSRSRPPQTPWLREPTRRPSARA